jgi:type I restriction enzyme S subunit
MNAERLLAHFERISEAPDAIARLRCFILDLAVRGKLVEQDPEDEPAEELLAQIAEARFSLIHAGKSKKQNQLFDEQADDPFGLPYGWQWARLPEVADFSAGRTPARNEDKFWNPGFFHWVSIGDMEDGRPLSVTKELVSKLAGEAVFRSQLEPVGTMVMSFKLTIGKMARLAVPAFHNEAIISIHPYLKSLDPYLFKVIPLFARSADSKGAIKGATLNRDSISRIPIPLPPLAEQHRIVAKVDELMALCDQLEAARQQREQGRERLVAATLQRLNQPAEDPTSFRQDASFALQVLPSLTTTPAQIKQLRQTILNLAVRGKLVAGSLGRIAAVGDYRRLQNGYAFKSGWFAKFGIRLLRNVNVGHGQIRWNDVAHIPEERFSEFARFSLEEGDIVLTLDRPFIVTGTKVARVNVCDLPALLLQRVGRFVEIAPGVDDDYLFLWINSPHFIEQIDPGRSNGVPHISSKQVEAASILIPPLAEQHRIVAKVDELMALCDQLEQQLSQADQQRRRLLEAVLAEALVGRLTTEQKESHEAIA